MISTDLIAVLGTVAFLATVVGTSVLAGGGFGLEQRAGLLERRDPGTAEALRRGRSLTDYTFGGEWVATVCTPSRRTWYEMAKVRATDTDLRVEAAEEVLPPMPATVVALGRSEHMPQSRRSRHPAPKPQPAGGANRSGHQPTASG